MASFFNSDYTNGSIHAAWRQRKAQLRAQDLQAANDSLYEVVRDYILARRGEIHEALLGAVANANSPTDLRVPLWFYRTAQTVTPVRSLEFAIADATDTLLRDLGYQWMVGLTFHGFDPNAFEYTDTAEWDGIWMHRPPTPVHDVVRDTDFLNRIALLFGSDHYSVSYQVKGRMVLTQPTDIVVESVDLVLHYHPDGLNGQALEDLQATADKYADHVPAFVAWDLPFVWQGKPVRTPPSSPRLPSPPPLVRRPPEDEPSPRLMRPCHCGYFDDDV